MQTTSPNFSPKISCIYVNYHSALLLEGSLRSLFLHEKDFKEKEVLVVNNDVTEEEALMTLAEKYPITILSAEQNKGFAVAANQGARVARGKLLFFINPDTEWRQRALQKIEKHFENPQVAVVGIGLVSQAGFLEKGNGGLFFSIGTLLKNSSFLAQKRVGGEFQEVDWVSGASLVCRKNVFTELGGFDEHFFMYFEDMDFCKRVKEAQLMVILDQALRLTHFGGRSHSSQKSQKNIYDASLFLYIQKHWSPLSWYPFMIIHTVYRFFYPYGR